MVAFFEVLAGETKKRRNKRGIYWAILWDVFEQVAIARCSIGQFIVSECVIPLTSESISSLLFDSWFSSSRIIP